jgi:transposase
MIYISGKDRSQLVLIPESLDQLIDLCNEVRTIDLIVESLNLDDFDFKTKKGTLEGRPPYNPKTLLKLYMYGYLNSIRSSRVLEKECKRNTEVMWLLQQLKPDHNTISNFRRDNPESIRKVFRHLVSYAKSFNLIGGQLIAGDSPKLRAQNSKKNNFNESKIKRNIAYIDNKLEEFNAMLSRADGDLKEDIVKQIAKQEERKQGYEHTRSILQATGEKQLSTSDPDSRQLLTKGDIVEVAYSVQSMVDGKHSLPLDYNVTNVIDRNEMGDMLERTDEIVPVKDAVGLFDKGFHTGAEIKRAIDMKVIIMVAIPNSSKNAPNRAYDVEHFIYNKDRSSYRCPQKKELTTKGTWTKTETETRTTWVQNYSTKECLSCPMLEECTMNKKGRIIKRSEYAEYVEQNKLNMKGKEEVYKKRQSIVEHPYGTIKRQ